MGGLWGLVGFVAVGRLGCGILVLFVVSRVSIVWTKRDGRKKNFITS